MLWFFNVLESNSFFTFSKISSLSFEYKSIPELESKMYVYFPFQLCWCFVMAFSSIGLKSSISLFCNEV